MADDVSTIVNADPNAGKQIDPAAAAAAAAAAGAGGGADPNAGNGADPNAGKGADPNAGKAPELGPDGKPKVAAAADPAAVADWRKEFAGENADDLKVLERFTSKADFMKSWKEQRATIAKGKGAEPLPKDATPEQVAEFRKANGIPEKADGYYAALPEGVIFGDDDKPGVTKFLEDMHALNAPPAMVSKALEVFVAAQAEGAAHRSDLDIKARDETSESLRTEWGQDYKANVNAMSGFVKANIPEADQANFLNARMGDGTPVFSHPGMVRAFATLGRTLNPTGTSTPGGGADRLDSIESAIAGYEKRMHTKEWHRDHKAQAHYRELVTARQNMTKGKK